VRRLLWLGVGLAVGALVVRAVSKKARSMSPGGLAQSAARTAGDVVESVRGFVSDVRTGMSQREEEIRAAFADGTLIDPADLAGLDGPPAGDDPGPPRPAPVGPERGNHRR